MSHPGTAESTKSRPKSREAVGLLRGKASRDAKRIDELSGQRDRLDRKIEETEKERDAAGVRVEELRRLVQEAVEDKRRVALGGARASALKQRANKERLRQVEAELARAKTMEDRLNGTLKELVEEINNRRKSRIIQDRLYEEIRVRLVAAREELITALDESNGLSAEVEALEKRREALIVQETKEQEEAAAQETALVQDLMRVQSGKLDPSELPPPDPHADELMPDEPGSGDMTEEEEQRVRNRIEELNRVIARVHGDIDRMTKQATQLQNIFKRMLDQASLPGLDELVGQFKEEEAFKYEQYGYIQRTDDDTKAAEERLRHLVSVLETERERQARERSKRTIALAEKREEYARMDDASKLLASNLRDAKRIACIVLLKALRCYDAIGGRNPRVLRIRELVEHSMDGEEGGKGGEEEGGKGGEEGGKGKKKSRRGSYVKMRRGSLVHVPDRPDSSPTPGALFMPDAAEYDSGPAFLVSHRSTQELLSSLEQGVTEVVNVFAAMLHKSSSRKLVLHVIEEEAREEEEREKSDEIASTPVPPGLGTPTPVSAKASSPTSPAPFSSPMVARPATTTNATVAARRRVITEEAAEEAFARFQRGPMKEEDGDDGWTDVRYMDRSDGPPVSRRESSRVSLPRRIGWGIEELISVDRDIDLDDDIEGKSNPDDEEFVELSGSGPSFAIFDSEEEVPTTSKSTHLRPLPHDELLRMSASLIDAHDVAIDSRSGTLIDRDAPPREPKRKALRSSKSFRASRSMSRMSTKSLRKK